MAVVFFKILLFLVGGINFFKLTQVFLFYGTNKTSFKENKVVAWLEGKKWFDLSLSWPCC